MGIFFSEISGKSEPYSRLDPPSYLGFSGYTGYIIEIIDFLVATKVATPVFTGYIVDFVGFFMKCGRVCQATRPRSPCFSYIIL